MSSSSLSSRSAPTVSTPTAGSAAAPSRRLASRRLARKLLMGSSSPAPAQHDWMDRSSVCSTSLRHGRMSARRSGRLPWSAFSRPVFGGSIEERPNSVAKMEMRSATSAALVRAASRTSKSNAFASKRTRGGIQS